jgi:hypothetical protein
VTDLVNSTVTAQRVIHCPSISKVKKILKRYFLWFVVLVGVSVLTFATQRFTTWVHYSPGVSCCVQAGMVHPSLGLLYLAFVDKSATQQNDSKRWRRDFSLALERRLAKRQARLALKTATQSLLPLALLKAGAR